MTSSMQEFSPELEPGIYNTTKRVKAVFPSFDKGMIRFSKNLKHLLEYTIVTIVVKKSDKPFRWKHCLGCFARFF
jgi:hypothetical protein